jgi:hypothetical protein
MSAPDRRAMVERPGVDLSVRRQCALLNLARSGIYRPKPVIGAGDLILMRRIDELHLELPFYGSRRITFELIKEGRGVNRKRVQRLMRVQAARSGLILEGWGRPDYTLNPTTTRGPANGVQFIDKAQADSFRPLITLRYIDCNALTLSQSRDDSGPFERRGVHEDILTALIRGDKAKTLCGVVPLRRAKLLDRGAVG